MSEDPLQPCLHWVKQSSDVVALNAHHSESDTNINRWLALSDFEGAGRRGRIQGHNECSGNGIFRRVV